MISDFLEDLPRQIEALTGYLMAGDAAGIENQAHNIKGVSANMGGETVRLVASDIEKAAKTGSLDSAAALLPELKVQAALLKKALEEMIG